MLTKQEKNILYKQKNFDRITSYNKIYRLQKIDCECGGKYKIHHKSDHCKTAKHKRYINTLD